MQRLLIVGCLLLVGCQSTDDRCRAIRRQSLENDQARWIQERVEAEATGHPDYPAKFAQETAMTRIRREALVSVTGDSTQSAMRPPIRPSDAAFYAEYCWEGRAR